MGSVSRRHLFNREPSVNRTKIQIHDLEQENKNLKRRIVNALKQLRSTKCLTIEEHEKLIQYLIEILGDY